MQTLDSIRSQNVNPGMVLAWDNGSEDHSVDILNDWIPQILPGRVTSDRPFENLGECLMHMVEECDSELLARIDADDINLPDRLEKQLAFLEAHEECVAVGGQIDLIDGNGREIGPKDPYPLDPPDVRFSLMFSNPVAHPTVIMRKDAVLKAGNYTVMGFGQDYDLWYRLSSVGPIANIEDTVVKYRIHEESVSTRSRHMWPSLHRELLRKYCCHVVPGVDPDELMRVWEWASFLGETDDCDVSLEKTLIHMGLAASIPELWRGVDFLATRKFRNLFLSCSPNGFFRILRRLQLRLHTLRIRTMDSTASQSV